MHQVRHAKSVEMLTQSPAHISDVLHSAVSPPLKWSQNKQHETDECPLISSSSHHNQFIHKTHAHTQKKKTSKHCGQTPLTSTNYDCARIDCGDYTLLPSQITVYMPSISIYNIHQHLKNETITISLCAKCVYTSYVLYAVSPRRIYQSSNSALSPSRATIVLRVM